MTKSSLPNYDCDISRSSNLNDHWACKACNEDICFDCAENLPGCFDLIANSKIGKALTNSYAMRFVTRMSPLLLALWVTFDMILDVRQSVSYYHHSYSHGAYVKWAAEYQNQTNSTYLQSVSKTYFVTASVIWITSPFLLSTSLLIKRKCPFSSVEILIGDFTDLHISIPKGKWYHIGTF